LYGLVAVPRLAHDRDTHLTRDEIAREALRQFDAGGAPSIRSLAAALKVAPTAIYYHYPSRGAIIAAAVELVWQEAFEIGAGLVPDPQAIGADELLVRAGLATRRAFARHGLLALHLAEIPEIGERMVSNLSLLADAFDALGLHGEAAAEAFHTYASYVIGSTLFVTIRIASGPPELDAGEDRDDTRDDTRAALQWMMRVSALDPEHDEKLFVQGLRTIVAALTP
jgi:AcrR family transcriptional regulator